MTGMHHWPAMSIVTLAAACGGLRQAEPPVTEHEVAAFMRDYETDLKSGNREAVIARYDSAGVHVLGDGGKVFLPLDSLAAVYRGGWQGPAFFEFLNLSYEPAGEDAMLVLGQFRWADAGATDTAMYSYTGLIRRTPAGLRIRVENESGSDRSP